EGGIEEGGCRAVGEGDGVCVVRASADDGVGDVEGASRGHDASGLVSGNRATVELHVAIGCNDAATGVLGEGAALEDDGGVVDAEGFGAGVAFEDDAGEEDGGTVADEELGLRVYATPP